MRIYLILIAISSFLPLRHSFAQESKHGGDLEKAVRIAVNTTYKFKGSPKGYGSKNEFPRSRNRSPLLLREERNTSWFLIPVPYTGILTFEVMPHSPKDDYDWMLFDYRVLKRDVKTFAQPLRTNNSRNDLKLQGKTGLKKSSTDLFTAPGPGNNYSKAIETKMGDTLVLIIDNIYENGSGFDLDVKLDPNIQLSSKLSGTVTSSLTHSGLKAVILCEDDTTGQVLSTTQADTSGHYNIMIPATRAVNITASFSGYLFKTVDFIQKAAIDTLNIALDPIAGGNKLTLFNIHFAPDKDEILINSKPELIRLTDFLKQSKTYEVRITGHTNNNPFADARYLQRLSFNRALAVKKHLMINGIEERRISCAGVGGKNPLYNTKDPEENLKNLRVEVILIKKEEKRTWK